MQRLIIYLLERHSRSYDSQRQWGRRDVGVLTHYLLEYKWIQLFTDNSLDKSMLVSPARALLEISLRESSWMSIKLTRKMFVELLFRILLTVVDWTVIWNINNSKILSLYIRIENWIIILNVPVGNNNSHLLPIEKSVSSSRCGMTPLSSKNYKLYVKCKNEVKMLPLFKDGNFTIFISFSLIPSFPHFL